MGVEILMRVPDGGAGSGDMLFDAVDLGAGGAFVRSDYLFEAGDTVEVSFRLPNTAGTITTRARVAWATAQPDAPQGPGFGLQFVHLGDDERALLQAFLRQEGQTGGVPASPQTL